MRLRYRTLNFYIASQTGHGVGNDRHDPVGKSRKRDLPLISDTDLQPQYDCLEYGLIVIINRVPHYHDLPLTLTLRLCMKSMVEFLRLNIYGQSIGNTRGYLKDTRLLTISSILFRSFIDDIVFHIITISA